MIDLYDASSEGLNRWEREPFKNLGEVILRVKSGNLVYELHKQPYHTQPTLLFEKSTDFDALIKEVIAKGVLIELETPKSDFAYLIRSEDEMKRFLSATAWGSGFSLFGISYLAFKGAIPSIISIPLGIVFLSLLLSSLVVASRRFTDLNKTSPQKWSTKILKF